MLETEIKSDLETLATRIEVEELDLNLPKQTDLTSQFERLLKVGLGYRMIYPDSEDGYAHFARGVNPFQKDNYPRYHIKLEINEQGLRSMSLHSDVRQHTTGDDVSVEEWERIASGVEEDAVFQSGEASEAIAKLINFGYFLAQVADRFGYTSLDYFDKQFRLSRNFGDGQRFKFWISQTEAILPEHITLIRQDAARHYSLDTEVLEEEGRLIKIADLDPFFQDGLGRQFLKALRFNRLFPNKEGQAQHYTNSLEYKDSVPKRVLKEEYRDDLSDIVSYGESVFAEI